MNGKNTEKTALISFMDTSDKKDLQKRLEGVADRLDRSQTYKIKTITKADILRRLSEQFIMQVDKLTDAQLERINLFGDFMQLSMA